MPWIVVDPKYSATSGVKVARVDVPAFIDEVDYESIVGAAFDGDLFKDWRESGGILILATGDGYEKLELTMGGLTDVPESAVIDEVRRIALERQCVVLKHVQEALA